MAQLEKGDKVALIAPSSPIPPGDLERSVSAIKALGLMPKAYPSCYLEHGYLAGADEERANDIISAFTDQTIKAVIAARGGFGLSRVVKLLDFSVFEQNPKPVYGYSDITVLHLILNNMGIPSYHSPMPSVEWIEGMDPYTMGSLKRSLFGPLEGEITNPGSESLNVISEGEASGLLAGGNLTMLASSIGTPYELDSKGKIIFFEDVGEAPYAIDRMITQLELSGKFKAASGVIIGMFEDCLPKPGSKTIEIEEVLSSHFKNLNIPVLSGLACGHRMPTLSLPLSRPIEISNGHIRVKG